jgi:hypothetical protein
VRDEHVLRSPGSDTARYLAAGAARVAWLRYRRDRLEDGLRVALSYFEGCPGLVVEGNSAARFLPRARIVVVARAGRTETKPSVLELLPRADPVVLNGPGEAPAGLEGIRVVAIDAERASDAGTRALVSEIATWARRPA